MGVDSKSYQAQREKTEIASLEPDPGILIVLGSGKLLFSLVAIGLNNLKLF